MVDVKLGLIQLFSCYLGHLLSLSLYEASPSFNDWLFKILLVNMSSIFSIDYLAVLNPPPWWTYLNSALEITKR